MYEVGDGDVNSFLDKLSTKNMYIKYNGKIHVYQTSNGEEWIKTKGIKSKKFVDEMTTDELRDITSSSNVDVTIE